jgi:hypothetical protein
MKVLRFSLFFEMQTIENAGVFFQKQEKKISGIFQKNSKKVLQLRK